MHREATKDCFDMTTLTFTSWGGCPACPHPHYVKKVDLSFCVFHCFVVFGGSKISRCLGKSSTKSVIITPLFVCPKCEQKLRLESSVPIRWQAKHGENDKSTPFWPYTPPSIKNNYPAAQKHYIHRNIPGELVCGSLHTCHVVLSASRIYTWKSGILCVIH